MMRQPLVCAEIGSNWWRPTQSESLGSALAHVREAARRGAGAVKFQLFRADALYSRERFQRGWEQARKYELPLEWVETLSKKAHSLDLEFWLSVFDPGLVGNAIPHVDRMKIASGDLTYVDLLKEVGKRTGGSTVPVVLSTGASNGAEIKKALDVLTEAGMVGWGIPRIDVLKCVSRYPAAPGDYRLDRFPYSDFADGRGLSDHTGKVTNLIDEAVRLGYWLFEVHFGLDPGGAGSDLPDASVSLDPEKLAGYVKLARKAFKYYFREDPDEMPDEGERFWARRGPDGLRPAGEAEKSKQPTTSSRRL